MKIIKFCQIAILFLSVTAVYNTSNADTPYHYPILNAEFDSISNVLLNNEFNRIQAEDDSLTLARLAQIADRSDDAIVKARALSWEIRSRQLMFAPDSAIDALEKSLADVPKDYAYDRAMLNCLLGRNYERVGRYAKAWAALQDAIPALKEAGDHYTLGNVYLLQGLVFEDIYQDKSALENYSLAESEYKLAGYPLNRVYFLKATLLNRSHPQEAVRYYKLAIENGKGDPVITLQSYIGLTYHYLHNGDTTLASEYFSQAKKEYESMEPSKRSAFELMILTTDVDLLLAKGDDEGALKALRQMEALLGQNGDDCEPKYYRTLYDTYNRLGNKEKAFGYLQKYVEVYERQLEGMRSQEVERTKAIEDIIHQQDLVERLEQKNRFTQLRLYYSIAIIALLCIITIFIVRFFVVRARKHRLLAAELRKDMETEKDLTRLREETLKKDISMRTREVTSSSLHLASKNDALQQVYDLSLIHI